jgi:hypothetical protein
MNETIPEPQFAGQPAVSPTPAGVGVVGAEPRAEERALEEAVGYVLGDCFFAVGQTIGMRTTVDYDAVVWWHDHFRAKFLVAMRHHGNRWLQDRENVTGVGWMLAERALRHAAGQDSIDVAVARRAAADVERYCQLHSRRAARRGGDSAGSPRLAGYWCIRPPR